ncbi:hypothetical protein TNCV_286021 [Trichonephila clavipes]|nr:hypothetical protein TNCV_286021 [Trichonephila clavipes]
MDVYGYGDNLMNPRALHVNREMLTAGGGTVMVWGVSSWHDMGPLMRQGSHIMPTAHDRRLGNVVLRFRTNIRFNIRLPWAVVVVARPHWSAVLDQVHDIIHFQKVQNQQGNVC